MDHSKQHYYGSRYDSGVLHGVVFHYDARGERIIRLWTSEKSFDTVESAQEAAITWAEENNIDAEME
jgi:hypothetical protein